MLALFPPQAPFFRLDVDELVFKKVSDDPEAKQGVQQGLAKIEKNGHFKKTGLNEVCRFSEIVKSFNENWSLKYSG